MLETYNDINGRVVNFFRVLREQPEEFARIINLTPWARDEYNESLVAHDDPLEDARRFFCNCWMSIGGGNGGFRVQKAFKGAQVAAYYLTHIQIEKIAARFVGVQIENRDAFDILPRFDGPDTLFYVDPPYPSVTDRSGSGQYENDMPDIDDHERLLACLLERRGFVVISGYDCELYNDILAGWERKNHTSNTTGRTSTEYLWLSPHTSSALHGDLSHLPLFGGK